MNFYWTNHSKIKMREYGISKTKVRKVISNPSRKEKGVAPNTIAVMKPASQLEKKKTTNKGFGEIWVMYEDVAQKARRSKNRAHNALCAQVASQRVEKRKVIASWRYPGKSPVGEKIPIPDDIKRIINNG